MSDNISVLAFAGSIRKGSYNKSLVRAAEMSVQAGVEVTVFELDEIPVFNADLEENVPESVMKFRVAINDADALLISTPEYNSQVSGVLKNALDWASRKYEDEEPLKDKPMAIMGASTGGFGSARAQFQMLGLATRLKMHVYNGGAQVLVSGSEAKFDADGELTDEDTKKALAELLLGLRDWTIRLS